MKQKNILMSLAVLTMLYGTSNLFAASNEDKLKSIQQEMSTLEAERLDLTQDIDSLAEQLKNNDTAGAQELKEKRRILYLRNKIVTDKIKDLTKIKNTPAMLDKYTISNDTSYTPLKESQAARETAQKAKQAQEAAELKAKEEAIKIEANKKALEAEAEKAKIAKAKMTQDELTKKANEDTEKQKKIKEDEQKLETLKAEAKKAQAEAEKAKIEVEKINKQRNQEAQAKLSSISNISDKEIDAELSRITREREALDSKRIDTVLENQKKLDKIKAFSGADKLDTAGKTGEEISTLLKINKSEYTSEEWKKVFDNSIKMKKYNLHKLESSDLEKVKSFLTK